MRNAEACGHRHRPFDQYVGAAIPARFRLSTRNLHEVCPKRRRKTVAITRTASKIMKVRSHDGEIGQRHRAVEEGTVPGPDGRGETGAGRSSIR